VGEVEESLGKNMIGGVHLSVGEKKRKEKEKRGCMRAC
jgi:hypothetical protein